MKGRLTWLVAGLLVTMALPVPDVHAQNPRPGLRRGVPGPLGGVSPAEVQQLFDAYMVMQAQQELQLTDEQYPRFLARAKALQDARRRGQVERLRILQDLRRLSQQTAPDEGQLRAQLNALRELDVRNLEGIKQAVEGVDQVLDVRQQARFRLFEEQMERRKVELLMRARQANRQRSYRP